MREKKIALFSVLCFFGFVSFGQGKLILKPEYKENHTYTIFMKQSTIQPKAEDYESAEEIYEEEDVLEYETGPIEVKPDTQPDINKMEYDVKGELRIVKNEKEFWLMEYKHSETNAKAWIGEMMNKLTGGFSEEEIAPFSKTLTDSSLIVFKLFKNTNQTEIVNYQETSVRLKNAYQLFMKQIDSSIVKPLIEVYDQMSASFDFPSSEFEILHEDYVPVKTLEGSQNMDFAKFMVGFVKLMFDLADGVIVQRFDDSANFVYAMYPELAHIFMLNNSEANTSGTNLFQIQLKHPFEFYSSGIHTMETSLVQDTLSFSGTWFLSEADKVFMKNSMLNLTGNMYQYIFDKNDLNYQINPNLGMEKREVEAKGNVYYKLHSKTSVPIAINKNIEAKLTEGTQNLTIDIRIE